MKSEAKTIWGRNVKCEYNFKFRLDEEKKIVKVDEFVVSPVLFVFFLVSLPRHVSDFLSSFARPPSTSQDSAVILDVMAKGMKFLKERAAAEKEGAF